eukprot:6971021-Ditylum_brightwellii.AAC.1
MSGASSGMETLETDKSSDSIEAASITSSVPKEEHGANDKYQVFEEPALKDDVTNKTGSATENFEDNLKIQLSVESPLMD